MKNNFNFIMCIKPLHFNVKDSQLDSPLEGN